MATYLEIYDLVQEGEFLNKIAVAAAVKAQGLLAGVTPTVNQVTWAAAALTSPRSKADQLVSFVLAANKGASVAQILAATDAAIQTNVDTAVDALIAGGIV